MCQKGISNKKYDQWKSKCLGAFAIDLKRIKYLEVESSKLMLMYEELAIQKTVIKDIQSKNSNVERQARSDYLDESRQSSIQTSVIQSCTSSLNPTFINTTNMNQKVHKFLNL